MDISSIQVSETAAMHVKNAAGTHLYDNGKPVRIIFYGPASRQFAEMEARQSARAVARHNANEGKVVARTSEDIRQEAVEDLLTLTAGFENLTLGDAVGHDLHAAVYREPRLGFVLNQGMKFVADWGNFSGGGATS